MVHQTRMTSYVNRKECEKNSGKKRVIKDNGIAQRKVNKNRKTHMSNINTQDLAVWVNSDNVIREPCLGEYWEIGMAEKEISDMLCMQTQIPITTTQQSTLFTNSSNDTTKTNAQSIQCSSDSLNGTNLQAMAASPSPTQPLTPVTSQETQTSISSTEITEWRDTIASQRKEVRNLMKEVDDLKREKYGLVADLRKRNGEMTSLEKYITTSKGDSRDYSVKLSGQLQKELNVKSAQLARLKEEVTCTINTLRDFVQDLPNSDMVKDIINDTANALMGFISDVDNLEPRVECDVPTSNQFTVLCDSSPNEQSSHGYTRHTQSPADSWQIVHSKREKRGQTSRAQAPNITSSSQHQQRVIPREQSKGWQEKSRSAVPKQTHGKPVFNKYHQSGKGFQRTGHGNKNHQPYNQPLQEKFTPNDKWRRQQEENGYYNKHRPVTHQIQHQTRRKLQKEEWNQDSKRGSHSTTWSHHTRKQQHTVHGSRPSTSKGAPYHASRNRENNEPTRSEHRQHRDNNMPQNTRTQQTKCMSNFIKSDARSYSRHSRNGQESAMSNSSNRRKNLGMNDKHHNSHMHRRDPAVVVVGTSLVRGMGLMLNKEGVDAVVYANPGCHIEHIHPRVTGMIPKDYTGCVVLQMGGNDCEEYQTDNVSDLYSDLIHLVKKHAPACHLIIGGIPPRNFRNRLLEEKITCVNAFLKSVADHDSKVTYVSNMVYDVNRHIKRDEVHFTKIGRHKYVCNLINALPFQYVRNQYVNR